MSSGEAPKEKVTYIGKVDYRNKQVVFGIKERDRTRHTYIIGKTGMGKSVLLENLAIQDIRNGEGVCFIDPHGSTAEKLLDYIPEDRIKDVIYFAPFDTDSPIGLNVLEKVPKEKRHLVANGIMAAFKKIWLDAWSARMEYILTNILLALLENDNQSLLGVNRMLTDKEYRKFIVSNVTDPTVKEFWEKEYANYTERFAQEAAPAIQNKVGQFVGNPLIRNIVGQQKTSIDLRDAMDSKKILIVNLSKGKVGEGNANLIGSLLITKIYLAAMSRADVGAYELEKLPPFYFYVDEFQNFANESFANILSEARKYNLALTVAHQYVEQMTDEVKAAVFGNVGTMITFRVGATDAEIFEKEFAPYFIMDDIVNLSAYQIYLRLMIDGVGSKPFSAFTLPPAIVPEKSNVEAVIAHSRKTYGKAIDEVEKEINDFYKPVEKEVRVVKAKEHVTETRSTNHEEKSPSIDTRNKPREDYTPKREERKPETKKPNEERPTKNEERPNTPETKKASRESDEQGNRDSKPYNNQDPRRDRRNDKEEKHIFQKGERPERPTHFDDKPAMSLKEALALAMKEKETGNKEKESTGSNEISSNNEQRTTNNDSAMLHEERTANNSKKEIPEDILRKLIEE